MECVSNETVLSFMDSGLGIALVPNISWNIYNHPHIQTRELPGGSLYRTLYLQKTFALDDFPASREFRNFCIRFFSQIQEIAQKHNTCKESIASLFLQQSSQHLI